MNRSTLLKLGALGTALYLAKNKSAGAKNTNKSPATLEPTPDTNNNNNAKMTPFTFGKSLADKFFGRK